MFMLDVEDDSFHVTGEVYSHPSDSEWEVVGRMSVLMGEPAISGMLESPSRDQQHAAITSSYNGNLPSKNRRYTYYNSMALISRWASRHTRVT
uniref:Uncharacterized protein n=1 Tax=Peronospora matthiolae TaxID=2874970 RepID=A0AAV1U9S5_9STRA